MILHVFIYYPLAIAIPVLAGLAILRFIGINAHPVPAIFAVSIAMFFSIKHIMQMYKHLSKSHDPKKGF